MAFEKIRDGREATPAELADTYVGLVARRLRADAARLRASANRAEALADDITARRRIHAGEVDAIVGCTRLAIHDAVHGAPYLAHQAALAVMWADRAEREGDA